MTDMQNKTPADILKETKFVIVDDAVQGFLVASFYDDNDIEIISITIEPIHLQIILNYIIRNHEDISVYQENLSNIVIPSNKQLYEALYL
jgi:hypothetical protein